jgi:cytochrome c oxidase cbb3-type subunit 3
MVTRKDVDEASGTETTGHEWDGIKELNTPLPRWWLWVFYATILWSVGYWILYPAWPTLTGYTPGILHQSQRDDVAQAVLALQSQREELSRVFANATLQQIEADPNLFQFAREAGKAAFGDNCATCHGRRARLQGLSEFERRRVAVGRKPRRHQEDNHGRRAFDPPRHAPIADAGVRPRQAA